VKPLAIFLILFLFSVLIFKDAFSTFFVQDDFILINQFSQLNLISDFINSFAAPEVTHWRPLHSFYFLILGNLFDRSYFFYHLAAFLIHALGAFGVYKVLDLMLKHKKAAIFGGFIYSVNPLHFVSLFWISGNATSIGFAFFIFSFLFFVRRKFVLFCILFFASLLVSESMIIGAGVIAAYAFIFEKKVLIRAIISAAAAGVFVCVRQILFVPEVVLDAYKIEVSQRTLGAIYYYILRTFGFGEISGDLISSLILVVFLLIVLFTGISKPKGLSAKNLVFFASIILAGLFPFVLLPNHLSPHYMNIPAFGFSGAVSYLILKRSKKQLLILGALFLLSSFFTVSATTKNNWVFNGAGVSKYLIGKIESGAYESGTSFVFADTALFSSEQAYISLGGGAGLDFWFDGRYEYCFEFERMCPRNNVELID
jgi:hypothetical protein